MTDIDPLRAKVEEAISECLSEIAFLCGRVWEAWGYGTMTEDDFTPAIEDEEFMAGIVDEVLKALDSKEGEKE